MNWVQNEWGGWRDDEHGMVVAQTPGRWWRLWVNGVQRAEVFGKDREAKAFAAGLVEANA